MLVWSETIPNFLHFNRSGESLGFENAQKGAARALLLAYVLLNVLTAISLTELSACCVTCVNSHLTFV